jgi:pimeloyl-ACP methyl ester carboxylesterase
VGGSGRAEAITFDGRTITFVEYGDPRGLPVLHHHGGLLSASDVAPLNEVASAMGVRLVSFDRPGVAGSTSFPERTTADGAADAAAVLDHLGIEQVRVLGWSMGGQYALATCHGLGSRVLAAAIVAGCPPLDVPPTLAELNEMDRRFTAMAERHPRRLEAVGMAWGVLARFSPRAWAYATARGGPASDAAVIAAHPDELASSAKEMSAQRVGIVEEYRAWARPWGFGLGDVTTPVDLWRGDDDHLVPLIWQQRLADELSDARPHRLPDEGHFLLFTHAELVLGTLLARGPA